MGQYWRLLNIDRGETGHGVGGKLGECFWDAGEDIQQHYKSNTVITLPRPDELKGKAARQQIISGGPTCLLRLPLDTLRIIGELVYQNGSFTDLYCFALTCQTCWDASQNTITTFLASPDLQISWNGDRVICVGDYARSVPPWAQFTEKELRDIKRSRGLYGYKRDPSEWGEDEDEEDGSDQDEADEKQHWNFRRESFSKTHGDLLERFMVAVESHWHGFDIKYLCEASNRISSLRRRHDFQAPILRNLTKKIFVRQADVDAAVEAQDNKAKMCLGDILLSQICWSDEPDRTFEDSFDKITPWAGDRVDIITEDEFPVSEREGWKDEGTALVELNVQLRLEAG